MKTALNPYLNFNGNAAEAMKFYQSILGGDLDIQPFGDMGKTEEEKKRTIHAVLKKEGIHIMASDGHPDQQVTFGDSVHMSLVGDDETQLTEWFNKLSEGGKVDMLLAKQFWGDTFGMLTDKFGIHWMVNISSGEQK